MKATLLLLVLTCTMAVAFGGLLCGSDFCKTHPCVSPVTKTSCRTPSVYRANHAGLCACCPACVTFLNEGAPCKTYSKELGETPSAICGSNLKCAGGICVKYPRK